MRFISDLQRKAVFAKILHGDAFLVKHAKPGTIGHTHLKIAWDDQKTVKSFVVPNLLPHKKGEKRLALYLGRYAKEDALKIGKGAHGEYDVSKERIGRVVKIGPGKYKLPDDVWLLKMNENRYLLNKTK
jgi:hypothetical protein